MITVRSADPADASAWLGMRRELWPDEDADALRRGVERYFAGDRHEPREVLIAFDAAGSAVGFAELSIRNVVDGCDGDHVGYLEGWYVRADARRHGVGRALLAAAERWARDEGCAEFGSDALVENEVGAAAHRALGFEEIGCVRTFRKALRAG